MVEEGVGEEDGPDRAVEVDPERASRPEQGEEGGPDHDGREHERHRDQRLQRPPAAELVAGEHVGGGQGQDEREHRRRGRLPQREPGDAAAARGRRARRSHHRGPSAPSPRRPSPTMLATGQRKKTARKATGARQQRGSRPGASRAAHRTTRSVQASIHVLAVRVDHLRLELGHRRPGPRRARRTRAAARCQSAPGRRTSTAGRRPGTPRTAGSRSAARPPPRDRCRRGSPPPRPGGSSPPSITPVGASATRRVGEDDLGRRARRVRHHERSGALAAGAAREGAVVGVLPAVGDLHAVGPKPRSTTAASRPRRSASTVASRKASPGEDVAGFSTTSRSR